MEKIKIAVSAVFGALTAWLGVLAIPFYVLVGLNIADYITGIFAAKYRGQKISSYVGLQGIIKKVCMWLLVVIGAVLDWLLKYAGEQIGIDVKLNFLVAAVVVIWLICNEIISILENISDIGVKLPPLLIKLTQNIKSKAEEAEK